VTLSIKAMLTATAVAPQTFPRWSDTCSVVLIVTPQPSRADSPRDP
jgi:hypothetical protein